LEADVPTTEILFPLSSFSLSLSFSFSFPGKVEGKVFDLDRLPLGGGILGNSPVRVADPGPLRVGTLSRLPPNRFEISFVGEGGRKPREDLTCVIKLLAI
jgi:hypothetical protein